MNFKPILFSGPMVRAILEGGKTQTRRIIKPQPDDDGLHDHTRFPMSLQSDQKGLWGTTGETGEMKEFKCPYGAIGDVLWVREEHYRYGLWKKNGFTESGRQKWKFYPDPHFKEIRYFDNPPAVVEKNSHRSTGWYKRLARFMPKSACRLFLEVTDVRIERLKEISEENAMAEGVILGQFPNDIPSAAFCSLWTSINGAESWNSNPWVWVITFKRIDKPDEFPNTKPL